MTRSLFGPIAAFEWRHQLKSPAFWVGCLMFFLLAFGATTVDNIQIGSRGNVNVNAPFAIVQITGILSVFAIFVVVSLVAGAVIRDDETGFAPIVRSTRITKAAYLGGRFSGAIAAALLVLASVPLGIGIGSFMPWLDAEKLGPFVPWHYVYALFVFGLPTLLIVGAACFALATATRSMLGSYVGAVALLVGFSVTRVWLRDSQYDAVSALSDPFGLSALNIVTKYWTAAERNTLLPPMSGLLLANRLLWAGLAALLFALSCWRFRFETRSRAGKVLATPKGEAAPPLRSGPLPAPRHDAATGFAQLIALVRFDMAWVFRSPAFFVLLFIGVINAGFSVWFVGDILGSPSYPATRLMVQALEGAFTIMPIIIAIYYGGELVWRDRERRLHEIIDATAAPDWTHLLPKIIAIAGVLLASSLVAVATAVAVQAAKGYFHFQLGAYALWFVLPTVIAALLLAVLSVFVQVLVPQKFIGWGLMLVYLVASIALGTAGFEHNLYNYAGFTPVPLSDMNGMARFWQGRAWLQLYWGAFATVLAVLAYGLWRRGSGTALRPRLAALPSRLFKQSHGASVVGVLALGIFVGSGVFIYFNTNVLNRYVTAPDHDKLLADLEREFLPFETLPLPRITAVKLNVALYPRETRAVTTGNYTIQNKGTVPIEQLHVRGTELLQIDKLEIDGGTLQQSYPRFAYRIYKMNPAMQPGEQRQVRFATTLQERGFPNGAPLTRIVDNGTFLNNAEITPTLGMSRDGLLVDRAKRRKYGLAPDLRPPKLEDDAGRARSEFSASADWVDADITVSTDADQTPIAPGYTLSDTVEGTGANARRTVHFKPDAPINDFYSIQSARYAVKRDVAGDVQLAVYYQPGHEANVQRMLDAMKLSLKLYSEQFSPYPFKQARIIEFPGYERFAQAFANTIPFSEDIGFLTKLGEPDKIDVVTYVTAHEMAHQWWGHQLVPSWQQGASMLVESFAQYSALLVMEQQYGKAMMRKFLKYELDRYLRGRGGEVLEELPLARVENQPYIHYRKGSVVMYGLRNVVGADVVNRAMAKFLSAHAFKAAPYPNTTDFLKLLRAEAGPAHDALITDLFEKITLLDLKAVNAKSSKRADGRYDLSFEIQAKKLYADGHGKETEAPLDESLDIGVFDAEPGSDGYSAKSVIHFERRPVRSGKQTVTWVVERQPRWVGVDPYNTRIDRNSGDNLTRVDAD